MTHERMERRMEAAEEREERITRHARRRRAGYDHAYVCHPPCPAGRCYCPCHQPREEITL